jgi:hypothetical protein
MRYLIRSKIESGSYVAMVVVVVIGMNRSETYYIEVDVERHEIPFPTCPGHDGVFSVLVFRWFFTAGRRMVENPDSNG